MECGKIPRIKGYLRWKRQGIMKQLKRKRKTHIFGLPAGLEAKEEPIEEMVERLEHELCKDFEKSDNQLTNKPGGSE